jgi:hypothetical protein
MSANSSKLTATNINISSGLILPIYDYDPGVGSNSEIAFIDGQLKYYMDGEWIFILDKRNDGSTAEKAALSAQAIKLINPGAPDGIYWINVPTVGPKQTYCIMDSAYDGGGWMMAMKATRGTTFNFNANYWTTKNVLNETQTNTNDGDAKFDVMNYFQAKDLLAVWPDLTGNSGCFNVPRGHIWLQKNFYTADISFVDLLNTVNEYFIQDANNFCGINQFSRQTDVRFYGFNYSNDQNLARTRWGFGWNENGGGLWPNGNQGSDDVAGGIGMTGTQQGQVNYSAGDFIGCCQNVTGFNRSARVEVYVR